MRRVDHEGPAEIVLMADPRIAAIPVQDDGAQLADLRDCDPLRVSKLWADDAGDFAQVRSAVRDRLLLAAAALPDGLRLLIVEGYRPATLQLSLRPIPRCAPVGPRPCWDQAAAAGPVAPAGRTEGGPTTWPRS